MLWYGYTTLSRTSHQEWGNVFSKGPSFPVGSPIRTQHSIHITRSRKEPLYSNEQILDSAFVWSEELRSEKLSSGDDGMRVKCTAILYCSSTTSNLVPRSSRLPFNFLAFMLYYWRCFPHTATVFQFWSTLASYKELYSRGIWVNQKRNIFWMNNKPCFQRTHCFPRLFGRWASDKHEGSRRTGLSQCHSHHR